MSKSRYAKESIKAAPLWELWRRLVELGEHDHSAQQRALRDEAFHRELPLRCSGAIGTCLHDLRNEVSDE